jgi:cytochrome c oxidase subunit II
MYGEASNLAKGVDITFIFIFSTALFFIVGISCFLIYTLIRYSRKREKHPRQFTGNTTIEIIWTVIPLIIVLIMFYVGLIGFTPMRKVPADAMNITAIGQMWRWEFDYGDNRISKDLVVPLNKDVKLNLVSRDVNHSLFIPAFRLKEDVVPGYNNYMWFKPTMKGEFDIFCAEYCGLNHSGMLSKVLVLDSIKYNEWYAELVKSASAAESPGLVLLRKNGCLACHSLDGSKIVGPTFKGLYGRKVQVQTDKGEITEDATDDYIKRSILDPNAEIVNGFNKGLMQSYKDILSNQDINSILTYFKSMNEQK